MSRTQSQHDPGVADAVAAASERLVGVVLLGGSVRSSGFAQAIGRSFMDLPVAFGERLADRWGEQLVAMFSHLGIEPVPVRLLLDRASVKPASASLPGLSEVSIEHDPKDLRGTAGVLHDISGDYADDAYLLVANAIQIPLQPLGELFAQLAATRADVCVVSHSDGTPGGFMLVRCATLRGVKPIGFVDMKEQALPQIARSHRVAVLDCAAPTGAPCRFPDQYVRAVRVLARLRAGHDHSADPFAEDWQRTFALVEENAQVDSSATIHDSIVLAGGRVERDAVVVRSVVCPGGVVKRGGQALDSFVAPKGGEARGDGT